MPTYTAPTTRSSGFLVTAAVYNTDLVENIKYFKDAPTFDGAVTASTTLAVGTGLTYTTSVKSTTALATPGALSATQATAFASTVSGASIMGFGTTNDVTLMNRAGTVVLGIGPNTTTVNMTGLLTVSGFGTHAFDSTGTGGNVLRVRNSTAGTGNYSELSLGTDGDNQAGLLRAMSSTYTTSAPFVQAGVVLWSQFVGGLSLSAVHASGAIRFYSGGTTERARLAADGTFEPGSDTGYNLGSLSKRWNTLFMNTTAIAGTTVVQNSSGYLSLTTSSRRYKEHITSLVVSDKQLREFLAVRPQWWDYKGQQTGAVGFISEDLEALSIRNAYGQSPLLNYNLEGQPESNRDFAIIGIQHLVLQQHDATIQSLTARIAALEAGA